MTLVVDFCHAIKSEEVFVVRLTWARSWTFCYCWFFSRCTLLFALHRYAGCLETRIWTWEQGWQSSHICRFCKLNCCMRSIRCCVHRALFKSKSGQRWVSIGGKSRSRHCKSIFASEFYIGERHAPGDIEVGIWVKHMHNSASWCSRLEDKVNIVTCWLYLLQTSHTCTQICKICWCSERVRSVQIIVAREEKVVSCFQGHGHCYLLIG